MTEWAEAMAAYRTTAVAALCALGVSTEASVQLFKCKGPDGKIVYSDKVCEADATRAAVPVGVSNRAHAIEEKAASDRAASAKEEADERMKAEARAAAEAKYGVGRAPTPAPAAPEASSTRSGSVGGPAIQSPVTRLRVLRSPTPNWARRMARGTQSVRNILMMPPCRVASR